MGKISRLTKERSIALPLDVSQHNELNNTDHQPLLKYTEVLACESHEKKRKIIDYIYIKHTDARLCNGECLVLPTTHQPCNTSTTQHPIFFGWVKYVYIWFFINVKA